MPTAQDAPKIAESRKRGAFMTMREIAFMILVAAGFLGFMITVGGLQWRLRGDE
jgi:hypothetical protein